MSADKLCDKLKKLHALMGSDNAAERETARQKINELLAKNKLTWNDLPGLLAGDPAPSGFQDDDAPGFQGTVPPPLDLIHALLERHLHLTDAQRIALTLWIAHTFFYVRFSVTPRLALVSPVRGCGKTTCLNLIKALGFKTNKLDHVTAAVLFRLVAARNCALLDEADNLDLLRMPALRAICTSGHHRDGTVARYLDGQVHQFSVFAPMAIAGIGSLPYPILHRSITLHMERAPEAKIRFDQQTLPAQARQCQAVFEQTFEWAQQVKLDLDPPMPAELTNRPADNWRVLLSIADACNVEWGRAAREAAVALSGEGLRDEDPGVLLLHDCRDIFDRPPAYDRLQTTTLLTGLLDMPHGLWSEWRGLAGDQTPRKLSAGALALLLAPFGIRSRTIWPPHRDADDKSAKGYLRSEFEAAWASYCDGTTSQPNKPNNIRYLRILPCSSLL